MASNYDYSAFMGGGAEDSNKIGVFQSMLAGVGSGLISIPKGLFSLGASLMDLGVNSGRAAEVERWFDDLTTWDEKAEATAAGKLTELLVNIGVPGGYGFKLGSGLAKQAMLAKKGGKYLNLNSPALKKGVKQAAELNTLGKTNQFIAGALAGGVGEGVFVGDVEKIGSFGDLLGGPTEIERGDNPDAARDILNRVKFGTEGALFTGVIGGVGKTIGKLTSRNKKLDLHNSKIDRWIDKAAGWFRSRSAKTPEFFDAEGRQIGLRGADANFAKNISRSLDENIDAVFSPWRTIANSTTAKNHKILLGEVQDLLLTGSPSYGSRGTKRILNTEGKQVMDQASGPAWSEKEFINQLSPEDVARYTTEADDIGVMFPKLDVAKREALEGKLKNLGVKDEVIKDLFGNLNVIRTKWADLFETLGGTLKGDELASFKKLFGAKFKDYLGSTYDLFLNDSILPWLRYKPTAEVIDNAKNMFMKSADEAGKPITPLEAEKWVQNILESAQLPKTNLLKEGPSDALFRIPTFFLKRTVITGDDFKGYALVSKLKNKGDRETIEALLGKTKNPMQTILSGTSKLSLIVRRNEFFEDLIKKSKSLEDGGKLPMFSSKTGAAGQEEARMLFGGQKIKRIEIDPGMKLGLGDVNPLNGRWAPEGIADALSATSANVKNLGMGERLYYSFALYPKAASQIAKTILSPGNPLKKFYKCRSIRFS